MARLLNDKEIMNIIDFIKLNNKLPPETAKSIVNNHKNRLIKQLKNQKIYPELIPELKKQLELNYIKSLICPGESIGILAAQSIGEKQTQNSIDYDEEIVVKYNGEIKKMKIGLFIDQYMNNLSGITINGYSEIQKCKNIYRQSVTIDEKIEWKPISEVSRHAPKGNLIKVTTESGRSVVSTLSHSHLKKYKRTVSPVLGSDLKLGDRIPVIRNSFSVTNYKCKKIDIADYISYERIGPKEYDSDGNTPLNSPTKSEDFVFVNNGRIIRHIEIDDLFIWFLGMILGNKSEILYDTINIKFNNYDADICYKIETLCCKYSLSFNVTQQDKYFFQSLQKDLPVIYTIRSSIFANFIKILTQNCSYIPVFVFGLDKDKLAVFLNTYFTFGGFNVVCDNDIPFLLTNFGIYSRIVDNFLYIQEKYSSDFKDEFGLHIPKNNLEDNFHTIDDNELNEEVTRLRNGLYEFVEEIKINTYEELDNFIADYIEQATKYNKYKIGEYIDVPENIKYLTQVQHADVAWEKIVKIELIEEKNYRHPYVYDFTVPGTESFALFSGIVVHNTLNT